MGKLFRPLKRAWKWIESLNNSDALAELVDIWFIVPRRPRNCDNLIDSREAHRQKYTRG